MYESYAGDVQGLCKYALHFGGACVCICVCQSTVRAVDDFLCRTIHNVLLIHNVLMRVPLCGDVGNTTHRIAPQRLLRLYCRQLQIFKAVGNQNHPYLKFSTGNTKTLKGDPEARGLNVRQMVIDFHKQHYTPGNMTACILGNGTLDELEAVAKRCFAPSASAPRTATAAVASALPPAAAAAVPPPPAFALPWQPGTPCAWPLLVCVNPSKPKARSLKMRWTVPPVLTRADGTPSRLLSHIIGHEGEGSLHAALKSAGLIQALSAGTSTSHDDFSVFAVTISLTTKGLQEWTTVVEAVFRIIQRVKAASAVELAEIWSEMVQMSEIRFRFLEKSRPYGNQFLVFVENLLENTDGVGAPHQCSLGVAACYFCFC